METHTLLAFGAQLRYYRRAAVLTQEELAARANLSVRAISDLERGVKGRPHPTTVRRLAEALGLEGAARRTFEAARGQHTGVGGAGALPATSRADPIRRGSPQAPFVGRARELALLEQHLAGDGPPVLFLAGEPGIGKSRLLRAAAERAPRAGWQVLHGGCQRRSGQEPFAPVLGALKDYISRRPGPALRADLRGCAWLVRLLPELAGGPIEPLPGWVLPPEQEWRLMVEAVQRFVANVAGPAGTLLILDDLQWAGADALDVVALLVRSEERPPLRVIGAYRDTEMTPHHALAVLLADLAHAGAAWQQTLAPLPPEEARQLLDSLLDGTADEGRALRDQVVRLAGGVPFSLISYVQGMRRTERATGAPPAVPWDLAQGVRQRVLASGEGARRVLELAAVIGRVVPRALLLAAIVQTEVEVSAALDTAQRARLLEPDGHETYRFVHDVIHEVVEADLGAAQRRLLHRRVAEALEAQAGASAVELLGYHYGRAGMGEKAALYLEQAGDRAWAQHATVAAEGYYRDVVERLDRLGHSQDGARVREKLGLVLLTAARHDVALQALEEAVETYRAAYDIESVGRVTARIGRVHEDRGTPAEGVQRLQPLVELLEGRGPSPGLVTLYATLADLLWASGQYREEAAAAESAVGLARVVGENRSLAEALWQHGLAQLTVGHLAEAQGALEEALPRAEAVGALDSLIEPLLLLSVVFLRQGALERSRLYCERARSLAEQTGFATYVTAALSRLSIIAYIGGEWAQARRYGEQALAVSQEIGLSWISPRPLTALGLLCFGEGRWDDARRYLGESVLVGARVGQQPAEPFAPSVLAECDLLAGHPERAHGRLAPLLDAAGQNGVDVSLLLSPFAWSLLDLGDLATAATLLDDVLAKAHAQNDRLVLVDALRVQALAEVRQKHWTDAEQALEDGLTLARGMPYPYAEGRLLHVYGTLHVQEHEPERARVRLDEALAIFRRLGAHKDTELVEEALAVLPARSA